MQPSRILTAPALFILALSASCSTEAEAARTPEGNAKETMVKSPSAGFHAIRTTSLDGQAVDLAKYEGQVCLVVNVASQCGFTSQYAGLQKLHAELSGKGFQVLAFPCNDFGRQEPGSPAEIRSFCESSYGVTFPMFSKVKIKSEPSPVYAKLIAESGETPGWNFCKYLVGKDGKVLGFYRSGTSPDDPKLRAAIDKALGS